MLSVQQLNAQDLFAKANKQFNLGAYDLAIYNYQKILRTDPDNATVKGNLAEAYFRTQKYLEAIKWYQELETYEFMEPRHMLNYAHVMKSLGQYDKAQIWYWKYKAINPEVGEHFALSCDRAKLFLADEEQYDVKLFEGNSPSSDFGVSFYNNKLLYCSFRTDMKRENMKRNFSHIQKAGNQLFVCDDKSNANFTNINFLRSDIKQTHNIGPLSYSGLKVAYTQNDFADGYKQISGIETDLNIFFGDVADETGDWENEVAFEYNEEGSATAFPVLLNGGTTMIFCSNRIGGSGNFDLYITQFENGHWTEPINLGNEINTPGNEITPSVYGNTLYFSSDFHTGIGGYDVFKATINQDGTVSGVVNLGKGVNSPMDDYYYTVDPSNGLAYFASTRLGGKGKEDIYIAKNLTEDFLAYQEESQLEIPQALDLEKLAINNTIAMQQSPSENENLQTTNEAIPTTSAVTAPVNTTTDAPVFEKTIESVDQSNYTISEKELEEIEAEIEAEESVETIENEVILTDENVIRNITVSEIDEIISSTVESSEGALNEEFAPAVVVGTDNTFDLNGAKRVAYRDIITSASNVYFIQLASLSRTQGDIKPFLKLSELGNLYKVRKTGMVKIRMGYYFDEYEAKEKLKEVKSQGFYDAFIVYEPLITSQLELVNTGTSNAYYEGEYIPSGAVSNFKIRLASYTDPLWFDTGSVKDIGEIEQWTKGEFTIFVLSGYSSFDQAEQALIKAINRGYSEAHIVEDVNGYLQKVQRN